MFLKNKSKYLLFVIFLSSCGIGDGYRVENDRVIYERPWNAGFGTQIFNLDADPESFEILGKNNILWAKDKSNVFLRGGKLDFLNPKTFQVINDLYAKDEKTVVCDYLPIEEADVATFKLKEFQDETGKKVIMGIDKNAAYTCSERGYRRLVSNSIDEFRPIKEGFYRDKTKVWWNSISVPNANLDSFEVLGGGYATDGNRAYYHGSEVVGADLSTFKVTSDYHAKDKNHKYKFEDRVD